MFITFFLLYYVGFSNCPLQIKSNTSVSSRYTTSLLLILYYPHTLHSSHILVTDDSPP